MTKLRLKRSMYTLVRRVSTRPRVLLLFILILYGIGTITLVGIKSKERQSTTGKASTLSYLEGNDPVTKKVMVLEFNPISAPGSTVTLSSSKGWYFPSDLEKLFISSINDASKGYVNYEIANRQIIDAFPPKLTGFEYTFDSYITCLTDPGTCNNDSVDYLKILQDFDVCSKRNRGEIDE